MGTLGATCFNTLTPESRDIPKDQWDDERMGMVCGKGANFADMKAWLEKLCSVSKRCDYDLKKKMSEFFANIEGLRKSQR